MEQGLTGIPRTAIKFLRDYTSTMFLLLDDSGKICEANDGFIKTLLLADSPVGRDIREFLKPDTVAAMAFPQLNDEYIRAAWHFKGVSGGCRFHCHIFRAEDRFLLFAEKPMITGDSIISQMGALNMELSNMTRSLERKNLTLEQTNNTLKDEIASTVVHVERLASLASMAAGIAHEITQPLNSIKLAADSALYWHKEGQPLELGDVMEDLSSISRQAKHIDDIIRHIRAVVNNQQPEMQLFDVNEAVAEGLLIAEKHLEGKQIALDIQLATDPLRVWGNTVGIGEVVINLISNAAKALGNIQSDEKVVSVRTYSLHDQAVIEVADNGPGVSMDMQKRIFEPFYTSGSKEGMGIGLAIVCAIVTAHHGQIRLVSEPGHGALFQVQLPMAKTHVERE